MNILNKVNTFYKLAQEETIHSSYEAYQSKVNDVVNTVYYFTESLLKHNKKALEDLKIQRELNTRSLFILFSQMWKKIQAKNDFPEISPEMREIDKMIRAIPGILRSKFKKLYNADPILKDAFETGIKTVYSKYFFYKSILEKYVK